MISIPLLKFSSTRSGMAISASRESGLTMIEVIFAVIIFSGAMITLLGLQSSNTARTREDRNKVRAMLAAREILSAVEIQEDGLDPGTKDGTVDDIFDGLVSKPPRDKDEPDPHEGLTATLEVDNVPLPEIGEKALQKVVVSVYWGNAAFEEFKTTYFLPGKILSTGSSDSSGSESDDP